jgi:hypothetical protein
VYGLTRATLTLIGVAAAGFLIWLAWQVGEEGFNSSGRYWAACGLLAAAGLAMALSQLLGGWTKWGWPRVSGSVFLLGFLPALVVGGWAIAHSGPGGDWLSDHVRDWSNDIGIAGFVGDLGQFFPAVAFAIGLVFGFTFDTSGPRVARGREREPAVTAPPVRRQDSAGAPGAPPAEPPPRAGEPPPET